MTFRFPFVPRDIYEDAMELLRAERTRNDALMEVIVKMKVAGGSIPRDPAMMRPLEALPPDPIEEAINENKHAKVNPRIRAALSVYADREKKKGTNPKQIEHVIRTWDSVRAEDDNDDSDDFDDDVIELVVDDADDRAQKVSA